MKTILINNNTVSSSKDLNNYELEKGSSSLLEVKMNLIVAFRLGKSTLYEYGIIYLVRTQIFPQN